MRCKACDVLLNDIEIVRKDKATGEYLDLCTGCFEVSETTVWEMTETSEIVVDSD